jgi:hypothetical protein
MWIQYNRVPPHCSRKIMEYVYKSYQGRCTWCGGAVAWPFLSPDLNPFDSFLWGCMKSWVYHSGRLETRQQLVECMIKPAASHSVEWHLAACMQSKIWCSYKCWSLHWYRLIENWFCNHCCNKLGLNPSTVLNLPMVYKTFLAPSDLWNTLFEVWPNHHRTLIVLNTWLSSCMIYCLYNIIKIQNSCKTPEEFSVYVSSSFSFYILYPVNMLWY